MAQLLKNDTRFWAVDKIILAISPARCLTLGGGANAAAGGQPPRGASIVYQVKRPIHLGVPQLVRAAYVTSCYGKWRSSCGACALRRGPVARRSDFRIWGAHPSVWLGRIHARADGISAIVYTLFVPAVLYCPLPGAKRDGFSILCFLNVALFGFLRGVHPGPGPRSALSSESFAALPVAGFMAVSDHAKRARPAGIRSL